MRGCRGAAVAATAAHVCLHPAMFGDGVAKCERLQVRWGGGVVGKAMNLGLLRFRLRCDVNVKSSLKNRTWAAVGVRVLASGHFESPSPSP